MELKFLVSKIQNPDRYKLNLQEAPERQPDQHLVRYLEEAPKTKSPSS